MADEVAPEVITWLESFAGRLGVPTPTAEEITQLLALAGAAARASARQAAPVACWLAAQAGMAPAEALALARA